MQFFVLANNHGPLNIVRFFLLYRLLLLIKKIWIFFDSMVLCLAHPVSVIRQSVHTSVSGVGPVSHWPRPCVTRDVCLRCWPCVRLASAVCDAWRLSQVLALCHVGLGHVWHVTSVSGVGPVSHWPRPCVTRDVCLRFWPCVTLALAVCDTSRLSQVLALCHIGTRPCVTRDVCLRCWPCVTLASAVCDAWRLSQVLALCHVGPGRVWHVTSVSGVGPVSPLPRLPALHALRPSSRPLHHPSLLHRLHSAHGRVLARRIQARHRLLHGRWQHRIAPLRRRDPLTTISECCCVDV